MVDLSAFPLLDFFTHPKGALIVAGRKLPISCAHQEAAFHLAERDFGRFVRAVRLSGAFDGGKARASLAEGELRVVLPRVQERRGRDIRIAGGADVIRQYVDAGLVDEFTLSIAPVLLGEGIRLFDGTAVTLEGLAAVEATASPRATHLTYAVARA